jgi:hypothetical protein
VPVADERRGRLLGIKLRALVADHLARPIEAEPVGFPMGAGLLVGPSAWVLVDGPADRSLGAAIAWAIRHAASGLDVIAEADTGQLARRARAFALPVDVWFAQGRSLLAAIAEPLPPPPPPDPAHLELAPTIAAAGADVNVEHGVVFGEVRGLEVCRVVAEPTVGHIAEIGDQRPTSHDGVSLEVGVGANDREAFRIIHGDVPTVDALAAVVESVRAHRSPGAPAHPLNRLAQERAMRWQLQHRPELIGLRALRPAEPPVPRPNLKDVTPCVGVGVDDAGDEVSVVCSVGVDLDLAAFVADVQAMRPEPVVVALRDRDAVAITSEVLGALRVPVEVRTVGGGDHQ